VSATRSTRCHACAGEAHLRFVARDVNRALSSDGFPYYQCGTCGLLFLEPVPDDLSRFYPADYHAPPTRDALDRSAEADRYKLDIVQRFRTGGRLAEIGPSWGGFVHLARRAGFEVDALEMDPRCCAFLRDTVGVNVVETSEPARALRDRPPYDVVALWHVIEHLPDPVALVRAAAERLRPGGVLVVAAPNPLALQFRLTGARWPHVDAPRHVTLIPPSLLAAWAAAAGLAPAWTTTRDPGSLGWNEFGWEYLLGNMIRTAPVTYWLRKLGRGVARVMAPPTPRGAKGG
jgi:2-polyprenyl-3-methyl-5-hydroxy-6-metoxy-1,4-benzoquinol methylase